MSADRRRVVRHLAEPGWWRLFAAFFALFVAWAGFGIEQLLFGVVAAVVAATVFCQMRLEPAGRIHGMGLVRFIPYFAVVSFRGGLDVARRTIAPSLPIEPGFVHYELRVDPQGAAAVFFAAAISLVPGTLCVDVGDQQRAVVHLLDTRAGFEQQLQRLERRVAAVFGESIDTQPERTEPEGR